MYLSSNLNIVHSYFCVQSKAHYHYSYNFHEHFLHHFYTSLINVFYINNSLFFALINCLKDEEEGEESEEQKDETIKRKQGVKKNNKYIYVLNNVYFESEK